MKHEFGGVSHFYRDEGQGEPVILIHGFPFTHAMWERQIADLSGGGFRVIAYDVRGHGQTDAGDGQFLVDQFVDDLIALMDHLELKKAVLCGLSMGGYIVLRAAELHPERVRAMVLCDTRAEADTHEARARRAEAVRIIRGQGVKAWAPGFLKGLFAASSWKKRESVVATVTRMVEGAPVKTLVGTLIALAARTDLVAGLSQVQVPVLVVVGEEDLLTPPSAARVISSTVTRSRLEVIPDAGHLTPLEQPEIFSKHLLGFLRSL